MFVEQLVFKDHGGDTEKHCKILDLQLTIGEWDQVHLLLTLLVVCMSTYSHILFLSWVLPLV